MRPAALTGERQAPEGNRAISSAMNHRPAMNEPSFDQP